MKNILIISFLTLNSIILYCQDTYYSNPFAASLYLNPAQTGIISGKTSNSYPKNLRFGLVNRIQWAKSGKAYQSHYFEFHGLRNTTTKFVSFGFGLFGNTNKQGIMALTNTQISASGSAIFKPTLTNDNNKLNASIGINVGRLFTNINPSELWLNDQIITGAAISRDLIGYSFENNNVFDVSFGIHLDYSYNKNSKNNFFLSGGYTNAHFTREKISYLNENYKLFARSNIYLKFNLLKSKNAHYHYARLGLRYIFQGQSQFKQNEIGIIISPTLYLWGVKTKEAAKAFIDFYYGFRRPLFITNQEINQVNFNVFRIGFSNIKTGFSGGFSTELAFGKNPLNNAYTLGTQEIYLNINLRDRMDENRKREKRLRNYKEPSCPNW